MLHDYCLSSCPTTSVCTDPTRQVDESMVIVANDFKKGKVLPYLLPSGLLNKMQELKILLNSINRRNVTPVTTYPEAHLSMCHKCTSLVAAVVRWVLCSGGLGIRYGCWPREGKGVPSVGDRISVWRSHPCTPAVGLSPVFSSIYFVPSERHSLTYTREEIRLAWQSTTWPQNHTQSS